MSNLIGKKLDPYCCNCSWDEDGECWALDPRQGQDYQSVQKWLESWMPSKKWVSNPPKGTSACPAFISK